jgi:methylglyoxal synthase
MSKRDDVIGRRTLVAVLASHDSIVKNNELARTFENLYFKEESKGIPDEKKLLGKFHFIFCGGTFSRLMLGRETFRDRINGHDRIEIGRPPLTKKDQMREFTRHIYMIDNVVKEFLLKPDAEGIPKITVLPQHAEGGVTILANLVVQRQCSIIWPFLSPLTEHSLHPENLALLRLCDLWNAKRLMNAESVRAWFEEEAERDVKRNPQSIPLRICLCTSQKDYSWPIAQAQPAMNGSYYRVNLEDIRQNSQEERKKKQSEKQANQSERHEKGKFKTIALIAHDAMKSKMVDFAIEYENELCKFQRILATGTTGQEVIDACRKLREKKRVRRCLSGPRGGDIQIATEILFDRCDVVVFFIDPLKPHPHIEDIRVVFGASTAEIIDNNVRIITNEVHAREWIEETVRRR